MNIRRWVTLVAAALTVLFVGLRLSEEVNFFENNSSSEAPLLSPVMISSEGLSNIKMDVQARELTVDEVAKKNIIETAGLLTDHNGPAVGPQEKEEMIIIGEPINLDYPATWPQETKEIIIIGEPINPDDFSIWPDETEVLLIIGEPVKLDEPFAWPQEAGESVIVGELRNPDEPFRFQQPEAEVISIGEPRNPDD